MPAPKDPEFRRRAVELARLREKPIGQIAKDLGIAESGLRRCMARPMSMRARRKVTRTMRRPSWCVCAGRTAPRRWRSRC
jgi:transposase-like protein